MKRATKGLLSFATAFLIVFSTFGNAFLVAEASEPTAITTTVTAETDATEIVSETKTATVGASKEETVTGDVTKESNASEKTEEIKEEVETVAQTDAQESVDLTVTASEEDGYVTLSCGVEGSTIYYSYNEDGKNGFVKYEDKIKLDTSKDIVIWAYASYDSESMDAVDGEKVKFEYKAAEAVDASKAAILRTADASSNEQTASSEVVLLSDLKTGDNVVITYGDLIVTNTFKSNKFETASVSKDDNGAIIVNDKTLVLTVTTGDDYVLFENGGKYLAGKGNTNGFVWKDIEGISDDDLNYCKWVSDQGYVKNFKAAKSNGKSFYMGCNSDATPVKFGAYVLDNAKYLTISFHKIGESATATVAAPTASVESGSKVEFGSKVELSCATEGAKIMYSLDGKEFKSYEGAIEITKNVTLSAYAELDAEQSDIAEFKYELIAGSKITDVTKLEADQEFVLVFNSVTALTGTASGKKLAGADVKVNDDKHLTYVDENASFARLKLVKAETEGQYYLTSEFPVIEDGNLTTETATKYLTSGATGNSLTFETEKNEYSLWTFEPEDDGSFMIKNVNAVYNGKTQYIEFYNSLFTVYGYTAGGKKDAYLLTAYTYPELEEAQTEEPENTVAKLLTRELYDGDQVVVYYPAGKKLMTSEATTNGKLKDVAAEPAEDGTLETKGLNAAVLTVALDDNGYYYFTTADGKYLTGTVEEKEVDGKKKTYANLILADEKTDNSLWIEEAASEAGKYYLKNAFAKSGSYIEALEYYSGFSLYGFKEDKAFEFSFYALKEGEKVVSYEYDKDTSLTVAQWGGNANYEEAGINQDPVNGDLYSINDMLDKNAKFTAVVGGNVVKPWTSGTSNGGTTKTYYMGSTGVATESDYMEFSFPSAGYGNMDIAFRLRASNTGAGAFQLQYSTDGENFSNFKKGTNSYKYTAYKSTGEKDENGKAITEPFEVSGSGDITDGIAKTSLAPTYYVTFTFEIPNAAANAENLQIRLVPTGELSAKGDNAPASSGVIRVDSVKVTGNPVVDSTVTAYVKANPASGEVPVGQEITLSSDTEGAEIYYSVNGEEFAKYDDETKVVLSELPATIRAYATKEGLTKSITVNYQYTQAQVATVKASPNGG